MRAEGLRRIVRYFEELVPDLVVEIKAQSEKINTLEDKIKMFLSINAQVAILIDPDQKNVTVYRSDNNHIVLRDDDILTIPEFFAGWELPIAEI